MSNILAVSKREITRLRTRFTGKSRFIVVGVLALAMILSYVMYHQTPVFSKGLYNVGVSSAGPRIVDERFNVIMLDRHSGYSMLSEKEIDAYVWETRVIARGDDRSQYAAYALEEYLRRGELNRIAEEYDIDDAFPLRIEIRHVGREKEDAEEIESPASISSILGSTGAPEDEPVGIPPPSLPGATVREPTEIAVGAVPAVSLHEDASTVSKHESPIVPQQTHSSATDDAVRQQLEEFDEAGGMPTFKAEFTSDEEIIIPSLLRPPIPLAQVLIAFLYIVPIFFVSIFFTSSFMEEKTNRKLVILLSAPVTPFQIILGKMLPYIGYSVVAIVAITLVLRGNVAIALAIFVPVMFFILSIYLMVALLYRTFKDQTFFSVLAVWIVTAYLVGPAMFAGVSELSYISPLTLAVQMYRGEAFGITEYLLATIPMYLVFGLTMFLGTRIFNEEYLMGFRPLHTKLSEAVYLAMDRNHLRFSVLLLSLCLIPVVFMVQLASIVLSSNLPMPLSLGVLFGLAIITEEIAKSTGIVVLLQNGLVGSLKSVITLSFVSALGFLVGEKLLLFLALSVMSESMFLDAIFNSGMLVLPLILHFITTSIVCLITARLGIKYYPLGIVAGVVVHAIYNGCVLLGAV